MELLIYKASAGSGKTFTLTVEYISRLITNPHAYRHILAVTFTNKATAEMKQRILQQLWGLSHADPDSDGYLQAINQRLRQRGHSISADDIRSHAGEALSNILHDYNRFLVCTIDSFFQIVTRNLARELGIGSNLNIELDSTQVLNDAVDHLIASLDSDSPLLRWISQYVDSLMADGKSWRFDQALKKIALNLFNESYIEKSVDLQKQMEADVHVIANFRKALEDQNTQYDKDLRQAKQHFEVMMAAAPLTLDELGKNAKNGLEKYLKASDEGKYYDEDKAVSKTFEKMLTGPSAWTTKTAPNRVTVSKAAATLLGPLSEIERRRKAAQPFKWAYHLTIGYLYQLYLITAIGNQVTAENREKNRFLLSETNKLINSLIQDSDASFIYEKIGTDIQTVKIDEFQDTSRMQWANFKPLLHEGLSKGNDSLIVGDVKQSIYRWRNGDWTILNNMKEQQTPYPIRIESLQTNYRSQKRIIDFNNVLFRELVKQLNDEYRSDHNGKDCEQLLHAYADVEQSPRSDKDEGYVKAAFVKAEKGESSDDKMLECLGHEVKHLLDAGIQPRQMAVLLRKKKGHLADIATYFSREMGLNIVSDEAFRLDSSVAVSILIHACRVLVCPDDQVSAAALWLDWRGGQSPDAVADALDRLSASDILSLLPADLTQRRDELSALPLFELAQRLYDLFDLHDLEDQSAYLCRFFDLINEYLADHPSDLQAFLQAWDDGLHDTTVPGSEMDGIRVLTIHAAKGLEFDTVIIPYCNWTMETLHETLLWTSPQDEPFNKLDLVPARYDKHMIGTAFEDDYLYEQLQLWIDNLNALYVALTRPVRNLIMLSNDGARAGYLARYLQTLMPQVAQILGASWDPDKALLEYGTLQAAPAPAMRQQQSANPLTCVPDKTPLHILRGTASVEFRQSNESADFMAAIGGQESPRRLMHRGTLLHTLFSRIRTLDDIDRVLGDLTSQGILGAQLSAEEIRAEVDRAFRLPEIQAWYDGSWTVFNECEIIWQDHGNLCQRRPDRVMLRDGQMVVVDFKFGKPHQQYHAQVQAYISLLRQMGYTDVSGYLWYVDRDHIVKI